MLTCLTFAGCEKETERFSDYYVSNQCEENCYICYVDGVRTTFPSNETDLDQLMTMLMKLAREGKTVLIYDSQTYTGVNTSKEGVVYTTNDINDAKEWGKQMMKQG